jgi:hypothetical protein
VGVAIGAVGFVIGVVGDVIGAPVADGGGVVPVAALPAGLDGVCAKATPAIAQSAKARTGCRYERVMDCLLNRK